jgi:drug/metabolite transporter (DMT)-like permease
MQGLTQVNIAPGVKGVRRKHVATMAQRIMGPSSTMRRLSRKCLTSSVWWGAYRFAQGSSAALCQNKNKCTFGFGFKPVMPPITHAGFAGLSPLGLTLLAVTSVGWGLNFPIMKHLLTEWPPLSSRGLCGIVGAAALAMFALARQQRLSVPRPMWLRLLLVSMLTIGGWIAFMGLALLWLNASEAAVLGISIPVWVAFLAWPILGERLSPLRAVSLVVALAGIAVLIGGNGFEASVEKLPGILCALFGAVCVGLGTVLTKHFPLAMPPLSLAAWQIGLGCLPIAVIGLAVEQPHLSALSAIGWASLLYMTLIQFCLCYVCWFAALERLPAATASIGTLLVPVIGVLAAAAMLHEPLGLRELAALVFTLGGVAMALRS